MKCSRLSLTVVALLAALSAQCGRGGPAARRDPDLKPALETFTSENLMRHIRVLASDAFEGRAPGTRGEELTVDYLVSQFKSMGLKPGNPDGSYLQKVPLAGFKSASAARFMAGSRRLDLRSPDDYIAVSYSTEPEVQVRDSQVVFVGYGIVAPEYGWDDYKGVDVTGKTLLMLVNDPPVPDPADPAGLDENMFKGKAMTYYGRWTYKYEIASRKGAAAAIIVHETGPAGYPYDVVKGSWTQENFDIKSAIPAERVEVESWITREAARKLAAASGHDLEALKRAAVRRDFSPVPLNVRANFQVRNTVREIQSNNVIARLDGSDPALSQQYVIYSAHWDHLGKDPSLEGDQVFNGALDNASGTAALLNLAEAFTRLNPAPRRTIVFLCVTAEEKGLLGARYYARNPLYPLSRTAAAINLDGINPWGRTRDVIVIGLGNSTLDDTLRVAARSQGRIIKPDAEPEKGFFYRSDHFEFARQGVPALYTDSGTEFVGQDPEFALRKREEYTRRDYHKVSDEVKPDWDLSGAVEDLQLLFKAGYAVARQENIPEWKPGAEFKSTRERMLQNAAGAQ